MSTEANSKAAWKSLEPIANDVNRHLNAIKQSKLPLKNRYIALLAVTEIVMGRVLPHTPCGGGCSHCCHMATVITEHEAERISDHTGRVMHRLPMHETQRSIAEHQAQMLANYTRVPCTFLKEGRCSIYEVRPMACRLHHNIADTNEACDISMVVRQPKATEALDLGPVEMRLSSMMKEEPWGDIREFFP